MTGIPSSRATSTTAAAHLAVGGGNRDQQLVRPVVAQHVRELVGGAEHAYAVHAQVPLARVVVDDPDRRVAERAVPLELADHELARVAGSDDHDLLAARHQPADRRPLEDRPRGEPGTREQRDRQSRKSITKIERGSRIPCTGEAK